MLLIATSEMAGPVAAIVASKGNQGYTCAVTTGGGLSCWGFNAYGQLGDGTTISRSMPVVVSGLSSGVTGVAAGLGHTCALTSGGGVLCWGYNFHGQLGDGTTTDRLTPLAVNGLASGVTAIVAGLHHTCALTTGGGVQCWGRNDSGQLGDGTGTNRTTPVAVSGLSSGVAAFAAGHSHTCALSNGGSLSCWGANNRGQLGIGTTSARSTPAAVSGLSSEVAAVAAGDTHTCAVTSGGGVSCWGNNEFGQLGDGTLTNRSTPTTVSGLASGATATGGVATYDVQYRDGAGAWTDWQAGTASTSSSFAGQEGHTYAFRGRARDQGGNVSVYSAGDTQTTIDTLPPTVGALTADNGALYTTSATVTLALSASDVGSGLAQMAFSNDGTTWSSNEVYATSKTWTLTSGDGSKTVRARFADVVGNVSNAVTAVITLDTTAPTGTVTVNSGASYVAGTSATLTLSASDAGSGVAQMAFSNDGTTWSTPETFGTNKSWTLSAGDGTKTVYARFTDALGNVSSGVSDTISLDTTGPTGTVAINSGAAYAGGTSVTLALSAADGGSGVAQMAFSNNGTTWSTEETYTTSRVWTLAGGDGSKTVFARFTDGLGNLSTTANATIYLDLNAPTGSVTINGGALTTTSTTVTAGLSASDAG